MVFFARLVVDRHLGDPVDILTDDTILAVFAQNWQNTTSPSRLFRLVVSSLYLTRNGRDTRIHGRRSVR